MGGSAKSLKSVRGENTDNELLELIVRYSGLSQYELSQKLGWSIGKVDGSIERLLAEKQIFIKVVERQGRRVKLIYPGDEKPSDLIEVSENNLVKGNPLWQNEATFYALDLFTIGIAGRNIEEWREIATFNESVPVTHREGIVSLRIPLKFQLFYQLHRKHHTTTINANNILLTVSGDIINSITD